MMIRFLFIFILAFISVPVWAQTDKAQKNNTQSTSSVAKNLTPNLEGALRGFVWGLPSSVVEENEKGTFLGNEEISKDNNTLFFADYIRGLKSTIGYEFLNDKLWRARIFIERKYIDPQGRINDLMTIQRDLTKRFGEPVSEEFFWEDEKEKNWPKAWGWAVFRGELFITIKWQDEETDVIAYLGARERLKPVFSVTYIDRQANELMRKNKAKRGLMAPQ